MYQPLMSICHPRFAEVQHEFERNFAERGEVGASVCITLDGETVVDLWGGTFTRDTVSLVFSCTKGATAICAHLLAERGELDLAAPVSRYWPEFAQNGKSEITVAMLLNHRADPAEHCCGYAVRTMIEVGRSSDKSILEVAESF